MTKFTDVNGNEKFEFDGEIFLIPNSPTKLKEFTFPSAREEMRDIAGENGQNCDNPELDMVQVWACEKAKNSRNDGDDNWTCHRIPECPDQKLRVPSHLPATMFAGKKEGDVVQVKWCGHHFNLKLNQAESRYSCGKHPEYKGRFAEYDTFENTLDILLKKRPSGITAQIVTVG